MKRLFGTIRTVFLLCGSVIGAGFLGGAELVEFFGVDRPAPFLALSGIVFFIGFSAVLMREKRKAELPLLRNEKKIIETVFISTELIFSSAMLAGIKDVFAEIGAGGFSHTLTLVLFIASCFFVNKGKRGAEILSLLIMPVTLIAVNVIAVIFVFGDGQDTIYRAATNLIIPKAAAKAALYSSLNVFIAVPAVTETVKGKSSFELTIAAAAFSVLFCVEAFLILNVVGRVGATDSGVPVLCALKDSCNAVRATIFVALLFATFTSFFTCFVGAASDISEDVGFFGDKIKPAAYVFVYLFSLAGLNRIVKFVYPFFGACGACYIINSLKRLIGFMIQNRKIAKIAKSYCIKRGVKADNKDKTCFGGYENV